MSKTARKRSWRLAAPLLAAVVLAGLLLATLPLVGAREKLSDEQIRHRLEEELEALASDDRFSGTVLVARDGVPIVARAYGWANREARTRNRMESVFALASVNKLFTAVAVGQLAEQGRLRLDDPMRAHGGRAIGHGGSAPGVQNEVYMHPGGYDVVVLSNYDSAASPGRSGAGALVTLLDDLLMR